MHLQRHTQRRDYIAESGDSMLSVIDLIGRVETLGYPQPPGKSRNAVRRRVQNLARNIPEERTPFTESLLRIWGF